MCEAGPDCDEEDPAANTPDCEGKNCGPNGCGGQCGTCETKWLCGDDGVCFDPCAGLECGPDEFGGDCGSCQDGWLCGLGGRGREPMTRWGRLSNRR